MRFDFVVLGATGLQGRIVTKDLLANNYSVLLCGRKKLRVEDLLKKSKKTAFEFVDVRNINKMVSVIKKFSTNIVVNCVEDDGLNLLNVTKACLKAGSHCLDLGSEMEIAKKQFALDKEFKKKNLILITGCGSVPGIGNVMLRSATPKFDTIETIHQGYNWRANMNKFVVPFSIPTIMEEFTNAATIVDKGKFVNINPMEHIVYLYLREIGKEKSWNEKHPEYYTFFRYYKKMGLKNVKCFAGFPKHSFDVIKTLVELGLGSRDPVNIKGVSIEPVEFLTEVLRRIKVPEGYKETENLWVRIYGKKNGKKREIKMECIIHTLKGWEEDYTNIDTGMPASIMAQMIKNNVITERGSFAPEAIVPVELFFKELKKRKMLVYEDGKLIN